MTRLVTVAFALLVLSSSARADVYGYVDEQGATHLATERLDARYALFLKGGGGPAAPKVTIDGEPGSAEAATGIADPALTRTRLFRRLVDHPNIARFAPLIRAASLRHGLDPHLVMAIIAVESGFEPTAVSDKGAVGLMQVLPATGERYGVHADRKRTVDAKLADPVLNLEIGTRYLADLRRQFADRPRLALAAYNAGENAVIRYGQTVPPFAETQAYVRLVEQFEAFYAPVPKLVTADVDRIHVVIPARRNLPDPNALQRLPAPADAATDADGAVTVPAPAPSSTTP